MSTTAEHYEHHLGPIYVWMAGGAEAALQAGSAEIEALNLPVTRGAVVLDLGAGFGMHAIPLARRGARVTAIDSSAELLRTLTVLRGDLPVQAVNDDLLGFQSHIAEAPSAILCMGDTITHLPDFGAVEKLIERAYIELPPGGMFVVSFRDYSVPLAGDQRFIPVRSDETRILTCFLEYEPEAVLVHDILHERTSDGWQTRVSHYRKLRLSPEHLIDRLQSNGFKVRREAGMRGMVRVVAQSV
jgi:2-polyprenyl-3-methyl-5-hydroxy-6-metoxy-1,4-benzoquinol methylase